MSSDSSSNSLDRKRSRTWIEDGVLCVLHKKGKLSLETILETEKDSAELIKQNKIVTIPVIVDLSKVDDDSYDMRLSNIGKVISSSHDLFQHESRIWIVGAKTKIRDMSELFSKMFMSGRIQYADTFAEAKSEALKYIDETESILER